MILRPFLIAGMLVLAAAWLSGCSGAGLLNAVTSKAGYAVERGIRYAEGERGTYDLYVPDAAGPQTPVVVFLYGGAWDSGSKDIYLFLGQSLASEGVIVAVPDYRVYPDVLFPGFVEDGARAVAAIDKAAQSGAGGVAPGRHPLFIMGHSAGAQIAALLALDRHYLRDAGSSASRLAGFVGLAGPYDFLPLTEERYKRIFPAKLLPASQPVNFVSGSELPMLLIAGAADDTVDPKNTLRLAAKARAAGAAATATIYPGRGHVDILSALATALPGRDRNIRESILAFIRQHS